jgi:phosphosulfolactate synthase (CoM biosynthesis protein A)
MKTLESIQKSIDTLEKQMYLLRLAREQQYNDNSKRLLSITLTNIETAKLYLKEIKELGYEEFFVEIPEGSDMRTTDHKKRRLPKTKDEFINFLSEFSLSVVRMDNFLEQFE